MSPDPHYLPQMEKTFERYGFFVSRETIEKLEIYEQLLRKWQKAINLVSSSTLNDSASRHFFDSAQLLRYIPDINATLADLGSGAGFPGMVLAILGVKDVHLIESDSRKTVFLQTVSRETNTPVTIHNKRVEDCNIPSIGIITARALAPLKELLDMMSPLAASRNTVGLFLKGIQAQDEIAEAHKSYDFAAETFPSMTDISGKIVRISQLNAKRCGT